ncbi:hypothetical protein PFISCL1PPCAC_17749, partial [Pristionchus fissidentatus]
HTYKNFNVSFDCVAEDKLAYSYPLYDVWYWGDPNYFEYWTVLCVAEPNKPNPTTTTTPTTKLTTINIVK